MGAVVLIYGVLGLFAIGITWKFLEDLTGKKISGYLVTFVLVVSFLTWAKLYGSQKEDKLTVNQEIGFKNNK